MNCPVGLGDVGLVGVPQGEGSPGVPVALLQGAGDDPGADGQVGASPEGIPATPGDPRVDVVTATVPAARTITGVTQALEQVRGRHGEEALLWCHLLIHGQDRALQLLIVPYPGPRPSAMPHRGRAAEHPRHILVPLDHDPGSVVKVIEVNEGRLEVAVPGVAHGVLPLHAGPAGPGPVVVVRLQRQVGGVLEMVLVVVVVDVGRLRGQQVAPLPLVLPVVQLLALLARGPHVRGCAL